LNDTQRAQPLINQWLTCAHFQKRTWNDLE
jgi:hypothetical protein